MLCLSRFKTFQAGLNIACTGYVTPVYQLTLTPLQEHRPKQALYVLLVVSVLIYIFNIFYSISYYVLTLVTRFCGSQHPPQMRSASNVVTVIMRSDSSVELDGFSLRFSTMQSTSGNVDITVQINPNVERKRL